MPDEPESLTDEMIEYINRMGRATDTRPNPQGFYAWMDRMRENGPMYIGRKSLSGLYDWMTGFTCGRQDAGLARSKEEVEFFRDFDNFVSKTI